MENVQVIVDVDYLMDVHNEFVSILRSWLTDEELREINRKNSTDEYKSVGLCATHEYCDPNMAMLQAMNRFGLHWTTVNGWFCDLVWSIAKNNRFEVQG